MTAFIDTEAASVRYRAKMLDVPGRRILVTNFVGTEQERDLTLPANCKGFGRIRHFRRLNEDNWPPNPLPIDPACRALALPYSSLLRAQVFQLAACNWRCWYCYVPFDLLRANPAHSAWLSPAELVDLYLQDPDPPPMLDLTGGQPDLVPEWIPWMMDEMRARGLEQRVYLWSDDSLSTDFFWRHLTDDQRETVAAYQNYGRVCCFKGYDAASFSFNTSASPDLFDVQFEIMRRLLRTGIDLYAYTTFTSPSSDGVQDAMRRFVDRLQELHPNLPLRTVPLEIKAFTPTKPRLNAERSRGIECQYRAIECWTRELEDRFTPSERTRPIVDVRLRGEGG